MTAATVATAATALYKYTYTLGRSLYVPLTSRCNSIPLPQTRGPRFLLPREVAEALVRVRHAELNPDDTGLDVDFFGDSDDDRVILPSYDLPLINGLYPPASLATFSKFNTRKDQHQQHQLNSLFEEDSLQPSISALVDEVTARLQHDPSTPSSSADKNVQSTFEQVVIAGEGEPTLRMEALLAIARTVQSLGRQQSNNSANQTSRPIPVRVITNGLCYGVSNLGYPTKNSLIPPSRHVVLRDMMEAGITRISVALNTANRHEYDVLMSPCCYSVQGSSFGIEKSNKKNENDDGNNNNGREDHGLMPGAAHDLVCEFILEAAKIGMEVEITGIDRSDVDKFEMDRLARMLLSVGTSRKRMSKIRWRPYFW